MNVLVIMCAMLLLYKVPAVVCQQKAVDIHNIYGAAWALIG